jgi:hypothetical protein
MRRPLRFFSALAIPLFFLGAAAAAAQEALSAKIPRNLRVNARQQSFPNGLVGRSQATVAASASGREILVGWNDAQGFCGPPIGTACTPQRPPGLSGFAFSTDGGTTWTDRGGPDVFDDLVSGGDPWLTRGGFDKKTFFFANLAIGAATAESRGIVVHRGHFSGAGFAWEDAQAFDSPRNATSPFADFYDKPAIVADESGNGSAYVSLTNFQELCGSPQFGFGQIEVWRTTDGGATWLGPTIAGAEARDSTESCGSKGTLQQSSVPAIGPGGEVYVVWQRGPVFDENGVHRTTAEIVVARSLDGGVTFDLPVKVADILSMRANPPVGYNRNRINDHPRIAVAGVGRLRGRVYVTFSSAARSVTHSSAIACPPGITATCFPQTLTSSNVFVSVSDDQGLTWSRPTPVAPPVPPEGTKRVWPSVTVSPDGKAVHVVYYEIREVQATAERADTECNVSLGSGQRRVGRHSSLVDTHLAVSSNGGASFDVPRLLSSSTSNWCAAPANIRPNFGDYLGSTFQGGRVMGVWSDGRHAVVDTFFTKTAP